MTRREAREAAFLLLFEWSFREDETIDEIIELARHCRGAEIDPFAAMLAGKTVEYVIEINHEIERFSEKWKLGRLSRVTLAALRMGVCELGYIEDIPAGATINEAVELMKKYTAEDEAAYVNGVLGAYHRGRNASVAVLQPDDGQPDGSGGSQLPEQAKDVSAAQAVPATPGDIPSEDDIAAALDEL